MISQILNSFQSAEPMQQLLWCGAAAVTAVGLIAGAIKLFNSVLDYRRLKRAEAIERRLSLASHSSAFTRDEIKYSIRHYIEPDCAQTDPADEIDMRRAAQVRESVMSVVNRFIERGAEHRHMLILADTGMGKTTFCLNYFNRLERARPNKHGCMVVALGRENAADHLKSASAPSETILILDALDEDPRAIDDARARVADLMKLAADFKAVIITCRSQFFLNDEAIPSRTGISIIRPRRGGEDAEYVFHRLYLLPFSDRQITRYVRAQFRWWAWGSFHARRAARHLIADIPELSARPMLLALVPDLIRAKSKINELYDLYEFMVSQWLKRENRWIREELLAEVSEKLAVFIYTSRRHRQTERVQVSELHAVASSIGVSDEHWKHLSARSLLNRDGEGNFKFSHRSIMEFMFVNAAIKGNEECFKIVWTPFMRQLFVSWGNSERGGKQLPRAREILKMDLEGLGLAPLAPTLKEPAVASSSDYLSPIAGRARHRRQTVPRAWREESIRLVEDPGVVHLSDFQYGLQWRINRDVLDDDPAMARVEYVEAARLHGNNFRLPSKEEFLSLLDAEQALKVEIIPKDELIWLGDSLGKLRPVLVSISKEPLGSEALRFIGRSASREGGDQVACFYESMLRPVAFGYRSRAVSARALFVKSIDTKFRQELSKMSEAQLVKYVNELNSYVTSAQETP